MSNQSHHEYMSGVERSRQRIKANGEVFTPTPLVNEILDKVDQSLLNDPTKRILDPSCGDGQFLVEALKRRLANGMDREAALSTIYGVDIMEDNVIVCRDRLLDGHDEYRHIVERNIVCHDALTYDYKFK